MSLDTLLGQTYSLDAKGQLTAGLLSLKTGIESDPLILAIAQAKLVELNDLFEARGPLACTFSTKYREYLLAVLG